MKLANAARSPWPLSDDAPCIFTFLSPVPLLNLPSSTFTVQTPNMHLVNLLSEALLLGPSFALAQEAPVTKIASGHQGVTSPQPTSDLLANAVNLARGNSSVMPHWNSLQTCGFFSSDADNPATCAPGSGCSVSRCVHLLETKP